MTRRFRLILSGSCALLAALLCVLYGQHTREDAERARAEAIERYGGEVVRLVVATEGLEPGDVVDTSNVSERDWLADLAPAEAVTGLDAVLGSEVSVPVAAGAPLTALNFRDSADAVEVPADRVALSVPTGGELGLPPALTPGTTLAAFEVSDANVSLIADDLQVLAAPTERQGLSSEGAITLSVAPADVAAVLAASSEGSLRLALPGDEALELPEGAVTAPTSVPSGEGAEATGGDAGTQASDTGEQAEDEGAQQTGETAPEAEGGDAE